MCAYSLVVGKLVVVASLQSSSEFEYACCVDILGYDIVLLTNGWKGEVLAGSNDQLRITEWVGVVLMVCGWYVGGLIGLGKSKLVE